MSEIGLTKRADINLGFSCNEKCRFCYYLKSVEARDRDRDLTTKEAKDLIDYIYGRGIRVLDFTGGEPTIRKDLTELISYAKEVGYESISLITNGIVMARPDYTRRLVNSGVDDFLFSLHGTDPQSHDDITGFKGSYDLMIKAINNVNELNRDNRIRVRSNTVVCGTNFDKIGESCRILNSLKVSTVNFILFNPIVEADSSDERLNVEYSKAAPYLMKAIDAWKGRFEKITVRYIPFCLMPGYESYITNMPQIQYDPDEWDYLVRTRIREGFLVSFAALCAGMLMQPNYKRALRIGWNRAKHEGIKKFLEFKNKKKGEECRKCAYEYICDGLWKEYAKWKGFDELKAFEGEKLKDPTHFLRYPKGK